MALRSLAGKLRGLFPGRTAGASRSARANPDLDPVFPPLNFEGSLEAYAETLRKQTMKRQRRDSLECQKSIRKNYRDAAFFGVGGLVLGTYFWSGAAAALADFIE